MLVRRTYAQGSMLLRIDRRPKGAAESRDSRIRLPNLIRTKPPDASPVNSSTCGFPLIARNELWGPGRRERSPGPRAAACREGGARRAALSPTPTCLEGKGEQAGTVDDEQSKSPR